MFKKQKLGPSFPPQVIDEVLATTPVEGVRGVVQDIGHNSVTTRAEAIRYQTDEGMIWQARPSLTLLIVPTFIAVLIFVTALIGTKIAQAELLQVRAAAAQDQRSSAARGARPRRQPSQQPARMSDEEATQVLGWIGRIPYLLGAVLAVILFWRFLILKTTRYAATSQRLIIEKGIVLTRNTPHELHDLGDFVIEKPLLQRLFGVGHLRIVGKRILSNGIPKATEMPGLIGIRNPEYVRDVLRNGGQLEAQRSDKLRWR